MWTTRLLTKRSVTSMMHSLKQLPLPTVFDFTHVGAVAYDNAAFGAGVGTSLFSSVNCNGSESNLLECSYNTNGCSHANDAGVRCQGKDNIPTSRSSNIVLTRNEHYKQSQHFLTSTNACILISSNKVLLSHKLTCTWRIQCKGSTICFPNMATF